MTIREYFQTDKTRISWWMYSFAMEYEYMIHEHKLGKRFRECHTDEEIKELSIKFAVSIKDAIIKIGNNENASYSSDIIVDIFPQHTHEEVGDVFGLGGAVMKGLLDRCNRCSSLCHKKPYQKTRRFNFKGEERWCPCC
jgi:hypothetical protein